MMDVALLLKQELKEVSLLALSRRGLMPHIHPQAPLAALEASEAEKLANLPFKKLFREVRRIAKSAGIQWFQVVDSLRPHTSAIWKRLTLSQKRSFVIHLAPYWEVHRLSLIHI